MSILIHIAGKPTPKGRARSYIRNGLIAHYTPEETKIAEKKAAAEARIVMAKLNMNVIVAPLEIDVVCTFQPPKSWPPWKVDLINSGEMEHTSTPDGDNILKLICDAFNGIVWKDDSQLVIKKVTKLYSSEESIVAKIDIRNTLPSSIKTKKELEQYRAKLKIILFNPISGNIL